MVRLRATVSGNGHTLAEVENIRAYFSCAGVETLHTLQYVCEN